MTKKMEKVLAMVLIAIMVMVTITNIVYATSPKIYSGAASFSGQSSVEHMGNQIITFVKVIGSLASVIILIVLGIKYMMGSTEEKAEYKKSFIPYIVGAVLIFAASWLAGIVYDWASGLN